jgi:glucosamine-6-phosphate deaminase
MDVVIAPSKPEAGGAAAKAGAEAIRAAIRDKGGARIIVATGASQFDMLDALTRQPDIDWSRVTAFHLDEYVGMAENHPASFRRYLQERFTSRLPALAAFHFIAGDAPDLAAEIARVSTLVAAASIDVCFAGIGENGHLAFNDPPADFDTDEPYILVDLDDACRRQQFGEGWFPTLEAVPHRAVSMSIRQILKSRLIVLTVPDSRKAAAVRRALEGPVTPDCPASVLQRHPDCRVYLDPPAAADLSRRDGAAQA